MRMLYLFTLLVTPAAALAASYQCTSAGGQGFDYKEDRYQAREFERLAFDIELNKELNEVILQITSADTVLPCTVPYPVIHPDVLSCVSNMVMFNINVKTLRFNYFSGFGYVTEFENKHYNDSVVTYTGSCTKTASQS